MSNNLRRFGTRDAPKRRTGCLGAPSVYCAAVVIFLEFFAFGLLTSPMISVLDEAFPKHTFLMNGLIQGVKGFLSFLSAPLIGALSDVFGRKPFLFLTVTFTCSPIPFIKLSHWWYFTMISISGIFSVTFSVVLAFVSDVTTVENRSWAYGFVSATFAASLIISPSLGAFLEKAYSESFVITLASLIALSDVLFIIFCVPESLENCASTSGCNNSSCTDCSNFSTGDNAGSCVGGSDSLSSGPPKRLSLVGPPSSLSPSGVNAGNGKTVVVERRRAITWDKVDPFGALRYISRDRLTLLVCMTTFLSYLPEAGEYSCFFVYLRLVIGFSEESVALFIAICGLFSCIAQTCGLGLLISCLGAKHAIIVGLAFEAFQLAMFGFFSSPWVLWSAGCVAGLGSITYPALSAFLSNHVNADQQGLTQGLLTGIRGLCGGLGPAVYGFIFFIFQVDLNFRPSNQSLMGDVPAPVQNDVLAVEGKSFQDQLQALHRTFIPGPPFAFGAFIALAAILVAVFIPEDRSYVSLPTNASGGNGHSSKAFGSGHGVGLVKSRRVFRGRTSNSESTTNLLFDSDHQEVGDFEVEAVGFSDQEEGDQEHSVAFAPNATERRRRLRECRHYRQPSASKIFRPITPLAQTTKTTFAVKLTNPLRRMLSGPRQRSHSPPQPHCSTSASASAAFHFLGEAQRRDTEAADLTNFRVPYRVSEAVIGCNEASASLLPQQVPASSTFVHSCSNGDSSAHHSSHTHPPHSQML